MMRTMTKAAIALATLGLGACTNADRFATGPAATGAGAGFGTEAVSPASDPASPQYFSQTIGDRVLFVVDQSSLTAEARTTLDGQARWLQTNGDYMAIVEGHADERGTREYNTSLSERRANSVKEYLVSRGVAEGRLRTVPYGKERPVELCDNESCYAKNRRAVTVISAGALS